LQPNGFLPHRDTIRIACGVAGEQTRLDIADERREIAAAKTGADYRRRSVR
jgi:hypothetical protein